MAKMFYTLEEAAARLKSTPEAVKEMVAKGQLQEFRDRDKLMFKVEQVDLLAPGDDADLTSADLGGSGAIPLADSGMGGSAIDLASSGTSFSLATDGSSILSPTLGGSGHGMSGAEGPKERSGISVFDLDETEQGDPAAVTQVTEGGLDEGSLETVGSGSGLMDLTRESDDTSLGAAALLEDLQSAEQQPGETVGASGLFEATGAESDEAPAAGAPAGMTLMAMEAYDGAGSGLVGGLALGMVAALGLTLAVALMAILGAAGAEKGLVTLVSGNLMMYVGIVAGITLLAALGGFFLGKRG